MDATQRLICVVGLAFLVHGIASLTSDVTRHLGATALPGAQTFAAFCYAVNHYAEAFHSSDAAPMEKLKAYISHLHVATLDMDNARNDAAWKLALALWKPVQQNSFWFEQAEESNPLKSKLTRAVTFQMGTPIDVRATLTREIPLLTTAESQLSVEKRSDSCPDLHQSLQGAGVSSASTPSSAASSSSSSSSSSSLASSAANTLAPTPEPAPARPALTGMAARRAAFEAAESKEAKPRVGTGRVWTPPKPAEEKKEETYGIVFTGTKQWSGYQPPTRTPQRNGKLRALCPLHDYLDVEGWRYWVNYQVPSKEFLKHGVQNQDPTKLMPSRVLGNFCYYHRWPVKMCKQWWADNGYDKDYGIPDEIVYPGWHDETFLEARHQPEKNMVTSRMCVPESVKNYFHVCFNVDCVQWDCMQGFYPRAKTRSEMKMPEKFDENAMYKQAFEINNYDASREPDNGICGPDKPIPRMVIPADSEQAEAKEAKSTPSTE